MNKNETFEVRSGLPERKFVKVYNDFLGNTVLSAEEKLTFISLKSFVSYGLDNGSARPSMETLCKLTSMSRPRVTRAINSLIKKKVVTRKRMGLTKNNVYTLFDDAKIWQAETSEDMIESVEVAEEQRYIDFLRAKGYKVEKEDSPEDNSDQNKEKDPVPESDQTTETESIPTTVSTASNSSFHAHNTFNRNESQEEYTLKDVKDQINYDYYKKDHPIDDLFDSITLMLYENLNSINDTIRVGAELKAASVVKSVLRKVTYEDVLHTIKKYESVTDKVTKSKGYLFRILYESPMQRNADFQNYFSRTYYGASED